MACSSSVTAKTSALIADYVAAVTRGEHVLHPVERPQADGTLQHLADGFEVTHVLSATHDTWPVRWAERRLVMRSVQQAATAEQGLRSRIRQAQEALTDLTRRRGKRPVRDIVALKQAAATIVARYRVGAVVRTTCQEVVPEQRVRAYGDRPAQVRRKVTLHITSELDQAALEEAIAQLGWRVYVTNQLPEQLSLTQAVLAYREEYLVERSLGRLKDTVLFVKRQFGYLPDVVDNAKDQSVVVS